MNKLTLVLGGTCIILCTTHFNSLGQLRITGTSGILPGTVSVTATNTSSTNVIVGGGTGNNGNFNTFIGSSSGFNNNSGSKNTFIGNVSGYWNNAGSKNTFVGELAGGANLNGENNTCLGQASGQNIVGNNNTYVGNEAGVNGNGSNNTFVGRQAGDLNDGGGSNNTFIGNNSGLNNKSGGQNISLGYLSGFSSSNHSNAIAIGYNSIAGGNNVMSLGGAGNTGNAIKVGIGNSSPSADLHIYKAPLSGNSGTEILSHWADTYYQSALTLRTGIPGATKDLWIKQYGTSLPTTILLGSGSVPSIVGAPTLSTTTNNLALVATQASPLMIGLSPNNTELAPSENISFVNNINSYAGKKAWECMRINKDNGFVGIHTRTAVSGSGSGDPKALFHVNLTNAAKNTFDPLIEGVRFEGLPLGTSNHTDVIVLDNTGNLARRDIISITGSSNDWHTNGNTTISPFTEFIGTNNDDDFRIKTNGTPRARFTSSTGLGGTPKYGNFELGTGSSFIGTADKSGAFGENNTIQNAKDVLISGQGNSVLSGSNYSAAIGTNNKIDATTSSLISGNSNELKSSSNGSVIFGEGNIVDASTNVLNSGKQNSITSSHNSIIGGLANITSQSNSILNSGTNNQIQSNSHNSTTIGNHNFISTSLNAMALGEQNSISVNSDNSIVLGSNTIVTSSPNSFTAGISNKITHASSGTGCIALGAGIELVNSEASVATGESNTLENGHGTFITGGHNYSYGGYNILLGQHLKTDPAIIIPPRTYGATSRIIMGERINSNLDYSMTVGFNFNRTMVTNERGLAIQLNPNITTHTSTYAPTANFEVEAGVAPAGGLLTALAAPAVTRSNIRFHHLPEINDPLPTVLIDPRTGELFMSRSPYPNPIITPNDSNEYQMLDQFRVSTDEMKKQIENQQKQIDELITIIKTLSKNNTEQNAKEINVSISDQEIASLGQNIPNPFDGQTSVTYYVPHSVQTAYIRFTNQEGKIIKIVSLVEKGKGQININATELSQGTYSYSLYTDGVIADTKKMVVQ